MHSLHYHSHRLRSINGHSWANMVRLEAVNDVTGDVVITKSCIDINLTFAIETNLKLNSPIGVFLICRFRRRR